jgi:hypothetical protein
MRFKTSLLHPEQIGCQKQHRICARPLGGFCKVHGERRAIARAADDRYPASRLLDRGANDALGLRHRQGKELAGASRGKQPSGAVSEVVVDRAPVGLLVEREVRFEVGNRECEQPAAQYLLQRSEIQGHRVSSDWLAT